MVKKVKLLGMGNDEVRYYFIFKSEEKFKKFFYKFMENLGFENVCLDDFSTHDEKTGEEAELKLKDFSDNVLHYKNKNFDIDIFFGVKKVILIIRLKSKNLHKKLLDSLKGKYEWGKSSKRPKGKGVSSEGRIHKR